MEWICKGVSVDWEAWSVIVAATVFVWDQLTKRSDRRAAGRLMARLLIPELKQLKERLVAIQTQMGGGWGPAGPGSGLRDQLIADLNRVHTPALARGLADLASLPAHVTDRVTSMLGWLSQLRTTPYMDAEIPYGLDNWQAHFQRAQGFLTQTTKACDEAIAAARTVGAPPSLVDLFWRWPRDRKRQRSAIGAMQ